MAGRPGADHVIDFKNVAPMGRNHAHDEWARGITQSETTKQALGLKEQQAGTTARIEQQQQQGDEEFRSTVYGQAVKFYEAEPYVPGR